MKSNLLSPYTGWKKNQPKPLPSARVSRPMWPASKQAHTSNGAVLARLLLIPFACLTLAAGLALLMFLLLATAATDRPLLTKK